MLSAIPLVGAMSAGVLGAYVVATLPIAYRARYLLLCATVACLPLPALPGLRPGHRSFLVVGLLTCGVIATSIRRPQLRRNRVDAAMAMLAFAYVAMAFVGIVARAEMRWFLDDAIAPLVFFATYWIARNTPGLTMALVRPWVGRVLVLAALVILGARVGVIEVLTARSEAVDGRILTGVTPLAFAAVTWLLISAVDRRVSRLPGSTVWWIAASTLTILALDQSRRYLLALLAMAIAVAITSLARNLDLGKVVAGAVLVAGPLVALGALASGGLLPAALSTPIEGYVERIMSNTENTDNSGEWRQFEAEKVVESFADHQLLGVGLGMPYRDTIRSEPFSSDETGGDAKWVRYVHSSPYWYLAKGGILGVATYVAALIVLCSGARRLGPTGTFLTLFMVGWWTVSTTVPLVDRATSPMIAIMMALLALEVSRSDRRTAAVGMPSDVESRAVKLRVS